VCSKRLAGNNIRKFRVAVVFAWRSCRFVGHLQRLEHSRRILFVFFKPNKQNKRGLPGSSSSSCFQTLNQFLLLRESVAEETGVRQPTGKAATVHVGWTSDCTPLLSAGWLAGWPPSGGRSKRDGHHHYPLLHLTAPFVGWLAPSSPTSTHMFCVHHKSSTCVEVKAKRRLASLSRWRNFYFPFYFFWVVEPAKVDGRTRWAAIFWNHTPRCVCVCVCESPSHQDSSKYVALREIMGCADSKSAGLTNPITTVAAASNGQQQHQPSSRDHSNFQSKWISFSKSFFLIY
jgi:hypothetical protein